jgi:hypothetical protein
VLQGSRNASSRRHPGSKQEVFSNRARTRGSVEHAGGASCGSGGHRVSDLLARSGEVIKKESDVPVWIGSAYQPQPLAAASAA